MCGKKIANSRNVSLLLVAFRSQLAQGVFDLSITSTVLSLVLLQFLLESLFRSCVPRFWQINVVQGERPKGGKQHRAELERPTIICAQSGGTCFDDIGDVRKILGPALHALAGLLQGHSDPQAMHAKYVCLC
jgi:hypothetical protein